MYSFILSGLHDSELFNLFLNTNIIAYFKEIKKKPEGSFFKLIRKGSDLFQIIGDVDRLAQGVGTRFDGCCVGFHLDGTQVHTAVSAAVGRAGSGDVDFFYSAELPYRKRQLLPERHAGRCGRLL